MGVEGCNAGIVISHTRQHWLAGSGADAPLDLK